MRKIYSLLLTLVMAISISSQIYAGNAVTVKVNDTGIGVLYFKSFGPSGETIINSAQMDLPNDCGGDVVGEIHCPAGYTMTAVNETTGNGVYMSEYDGETYISINPGTAPGKNVFNITVTANGGGGGGEDPVDQKVTFVFSPAGSGYVVSAHSDDSGAIVEDEIFKSAAGEEEVEVTHNPNGYYIIKPNPGFSLLTAKDEADTNPHNEGDKPNGDGNIQIQGGMVKAGASIIVKAVKNGSFTVRGEGENIANIQMQNLTTYDMVTVGTEATTVSFTGGTQYKIYSSGSAQLWKVEVTDADNYKTELTGNYGNFWYTPNQGDKVVIYSDKPVQYAKPKITFEGDANKSMIKKVMYGSTVYDENAWGSDNWSIVAGDYLVILLDDAGYTNISCKVNGSTYTLQSNLDGKYLGMTLNNGSATVKDYNIVISAKKEKTYNVTLVCDHPEAVSVAPMVGYNTGTPLAFTTSGQSFEVKEGNNQLKFTATGSWIVDGILVDGELPKDGEYYDNSYFVNNDCTITINVSNKADKRTKTAVVYVDESVAKPMYLDFKYNGQTAVTIQPGYNFVPFGDDDLPFSFGYYAGGEAVFYVNGSKITSPMSCAETLNLEDGAVIKYFNGTPTAQIVSYEVKNELADLVEICHDYMTSVDFTSTTQHACFKGTQIHIKQKAEAASTGSRAGAPFEVAVNGTQIEPDDEGVYSIKVGDEAIAVQVSKGGQTGVEDVFADADATFTVYNLQGVQVKRNATTDDLNSLPAGIYIANGRKVVVNK